MSARVRPLLSLYLKGIFEKILLLYRIIWYISTKNYGSIVNVKNTVILILFLILYIIILLKNCSQVVKIAMSSRTEVKF